MDIGGGNLYTNSLNYVKIDALIRKIFKIVENVNTNVLVKMFCNDKVYEDGLFCKLRMYPLTG